MYPLVPTLKTMCFKAVLFLVSLLHSFPYMLSVYSVTGTKTKDSHDFLPSRSICYKKETKANHCIKKYLSVIMVHTGALERYW